MPSLPKPTDTEFCPDQEQTYQALMELLPRGRAWGNSPTNSGRDTLMKKLIFGIAGTWTTMETTICDALNDWFCFSSVADMNRWSADYGVPDECDLYNASVCAKVSAGQPPTAGYLLALLAANGYVGNGRWLTGNDVEFPGVRATFRVVIDPSISPVYLNSSLLPFPLGSGHLLGYPSIEEVDCMITRYLPAECVCDALLAALWEPVAGLGTDLVAWWHADDTANGLVSSWTDRVLGIAATSAGSARPTSGLVDAGNGTYRFVTFDGVDDALDLATLTGLRNGTQTGELWGLVRQNAAADAQRTAFSYGSGIDYRGIDRAILGADSRLAPTMGPGDYIDTANDFSGTTVPMSGHDGTKVYGRLNGHLTDPVSLPDAALNTPTTRGRIGAGANNTPTQLWQGNIRHIIVTKPLSPAKTLRLESWLAWDVGMASLLDGSHPYRTMRP